MTPIRRNPQGGQPSHLDRADIALTHAADTLGEIRATGPTLLQLDLVFEWLTQAHLSVLDAQAATGKRPVQANHA